jgi:hypothetical protein
MQLVFAVLLGVAGSYFDVRRNVALSRIVGDHHWRGALWRAAFGLPFCGAAYLVFAWLVPNSIRLSVDGGLWLLTAAAAQFCSQTFVLTLARQEGFAPMAVRSSASISLAVMFGFILLGEGNWAAMIMAAIAVLGSGTLFNEAWSEGVTLQGGLARGGAPLWLRKAIIRLLPGASLALQAVCFRAASASLFEDPGLTAGIGIATLAMLVQALVLAPSLRLMDENAFNNLMQQPVQRLMGVGLPSALSAILTFSAYSLAQAGFVRLVSSIAAFAVSYRIDRKLTLKRRSRREIIEMTLVLAMAVLSSLIALAP